MFALNMDMLYFAAIEAEKNSLYGPEISRIVGMPVPVETFSVNSTTLVSQVETG